MNNHTYMSTAKLYLPLFKLGDHHQGHNVNSSFPNEDCVHIQETMELRWGQGRPHLLEQWKIIHLLEQVKFF